MNTSDPVEKAVEELSDQRAGWVTRRDAAVRLGEIARMALASLEAHRDEEDVDVGRAVNEALGRLRVPEPRAVGEQTLESLVRYAEREGARDVEADGDGFRVRVRLNQGRSQTVHVEEKHLRNGGAVVSVFTRCGEAGEGTQRWALRTNGKMVHCAFAVDRDGETDTLILVNNIDRGHATPEAVKAAIKEMAVYGDWIENKISGQDEL